MPAAPLQRPSSLAAICRGAAAVELIAAVVALAFLGKVAAGYEEVGVRLPAATRVALAGNGAVAWGVLLAMAVVLVLAARFGSERSRSFAILAAAIVSGVLGLAVPILVLLPLQG